MIHDAGRPRTGEIKVGNIPEELKVLDQWVNWAGIWNAEGEKFSKPPMTANGRNASSTGEGTWTTLEKSLAAVGRTGVYTDNAGTRHRVTLDGVGLAGLGRTRYTGADLDGCRDPETGEISRAAQEIVDALDSYTEISPSGEGLRVFLRAEKPPTWSANKGGETDIEVYDKGRFLTVTGNHLKGTPRRVESRQEALDAFMQRYAPDRPKVEREPYKGPEGYVLDLERFLGEFGVAVVKQAKDATSERAYSITCPWVHEHTGGDASGTKVGQYPSGAVWFQCRHAHCDGRKWEQFREELDPEAYRRVSITVGGRNGTASITAGGNGARREGFNNTDLGNCGRLVAHHGEDLRYCYPWRRWLVWDGRRWAVDGSGEVHRRAKRTVKGIYREAGAATDDESRKALAKHAMRSEAENRIQAMISLAKSEVPVMPEALDRDPWLLNVLNGTIDLRTGELREHLREDLLTKLAPVEYLPDADAPTWAAVLERTIPAEPVREFFKKLCGRAFSGDVSEHVLPVLYGTGANGKSTVLNALLEAAGEYGMQAAPDLLIAKRGNHPTEVADLFGMRFVASIEVEDGRRLAESLVKTLTGGDRVRARRMKQDFWEFAPTHKVFMAVNHKPQVKGGETAIWRRIKLISFTETIPAAEQDKRLPEKLRAELPGILRWAVEGCLEWQREGLREPKPVTDATKQYREDMDTLAGFFEDRCVIDARLMTPASRLYKAYQIWCDGAGEHTETQKMFGTRLSERGFASEKIKRGQHKDRKGWLGIGLRADDPEPEDPDDGGNTKLYGASGAGDGPLAPNTADDRPLGENAGFAGETPGSAPTADDSGPLNQVSPLKPPREGVIRKQGPHRPLSSAGESRHRDPEAFDWTVGRGT